MKLYRSYLGAIITSAISIVCAVAALGMLSDNKRMPGQNALGGYGEISNTGNYSQHYYYDDTSFYYFASVPTWGHLFNELYSYDFSTGESSRVCKRISCTHQSKSCSLYPLFQGENTNPNGIWCLVDNSFISLSNQRAEMMISFWNPLTDQRNEVLTIPRYSSITDSQGLDGEYESFFNDSLRLNDELVLIGYNNEMHIFDSSYHDLYYFPCNGLTYPMVTADRLFWLGMQNELNCVHLNTGEMETDMLQGLFETNNSKIISIWETGQEFAAFTYNDEIYFPHNNTVYSYNPEVKSVRELTKIDPLTQDDPYACFGSDNIMYYKLNGTVQRMNLDTGTIDSFTKLTKVPCVSVHDYLLFVDPNCTGVDDITCWKRETLS